MIRVVIKNPVHLALDKSVSRVYQHPAQVNLRASAPLFVRECSLRQRLCHNERWHDVDELLRFVITVCPTPSPLHSMCWR